MTVAEAAAALNRSSKTILRWIESGKMKARKHGYMWFVEVAEVERLKAMKGEKKNDNKSCKQSNCGRTTSHN